MEIIEATPSKALRLERQSAVLSIAAGVIHALLSPVHLEEWWGYGLFFFFAAAAQIIFGVALGGGLFDPKTWRGDAYKAEQTFIILGLVGNAFIILMYVVSRTVGIPFFGPEAGEVEKVGFIDVVSKLVEVALIWLLVQLRRAKRAEHTAVPA